MNNQVTFVPLQRVQITVSTAFFDKEGQQAYDIYTDKLSICPVHRLNPKHC